MLKCGMTLEKTVAMQKEAVEWPDGNDASL
jgi:hypothetical protein